MAIMTTSKTSATESTEPKLHFPFLWKDTSGTIFIRRYMQTDIAIGGVIQLEDVGKQRTSTTPAEQAWNQRLSGDVSVTLRNFFS